MLKCQQSIDSMYSRIYLDYVPDMKTCFSFHLVVMIAKKIKKKSEGAVSACVDYLKKIVDRLYILPEYAEKIDYVCNCFHVCYFRIWFLFEGVDELDKAPSRRSLIQYIYSHSYWHDICNSCISCFVMSPREFFYVLYYR